MGVAVAAVAADAPPRRRLTRRTPAVAAGGGRQGGGGGGGGFGGGRGGDFRNYSPDSSMFAFAREHNLFVVKVATKDTDPAHARRREELQLRRARHAAGAAAAGAQPAATTAAAGRQQRRRWRRQGGGGQSRSARSRQRHLVAGLEGVRRHAHGSAQGAASCILVNNIANPRPTLMSYSYAMPGEENVGAGRAVRRTRPATRSSRR